MSLRRLHVAFVRILFNISLARDKLIDEGDEGKEQQVEEYVSRHDLPFGEAIEADVPYFAEHGEHGVCLD